jgi:septal ring factor EnvC (AmiA/AmiB activator)
MLAKPRKKLASLVAVVALAAVGAGCGSNPPCETDLSQVDKARSEAKAAEMKLEEAQSQKAQLERQIADEKARHGELEAKKAELEAKIEELGR